MKCGMLAVKFGGAVFEIPAGSYKKYVSLTQDGIQSFCVGLVGSLRPQNARFSSTPGAQTKVD
jgi:hypothetical protein